MSRTSMQAALASLVISMALSGCTGCGKDEIGKNNLEENNTTGSNNTTGTNNTTGSNNTTGTNNTTGSNNTTGTNNTTGSNNTNGTNGTNNTNGARALDVLLVIDNSGSTCTVQADLRANLRAALAQLTATDLDVQIGVTTTDTNPDYPLEPVARPGVLQSTPQPIPGFDRSCHTSEPGDYEPILEALQAALLCSDVDPADYAWDNAAIECALYATPQNCEIPGVCGGGGSPCVSTDLFPPPSSFRPLPTVLEVREYVDETGKIDFETLAADFACMSHVGTRGYGIEKGLEAAVLAVSPDLTGGAKGAADADTTAPNHGLIRADANFGLLFLTDENDCSHDGTLAENTVCGGDVCEFANIPGEPSPLIEPAVFADQLIENLRISKGDPEFSMSRVRVASIHGRWNRFQGPAPSDAECGDSDYPGISPICDPEDPDDPAARRAYSGDRYERFLDAFPDTNTFPARMSAGDHRLGAACESDLSPIFIDAMGVLAN